MSDDLLKHVRLLAGHAGTVNQACRVVEKEILRAKLLGVPANEARIEQAVQRIERRMMEAADLIRLQPRQPRRKAPERSNG